MRLLMICFDKSISFMGCSIVYSLPQLQINREVLKDEGNFGE